MTTTITAEDLARLRELAQKATPGPWRWEINEDAKCVAMVGGRPTFDKYIMDFVRWGMGGAAPRFNDAVAEGEYNIMERVEKYSAVVPGREHHANWFKSVGHPDAAFMVGANPAAILALLDQLEAAEKALMNPPDCRMCGDSGIVGRAPDDYFDCPDCLAKRKTDQYAARYRHARENPSIMYEQWEPVALGAEEIDAAIDAAIATQGESK